MNKRTTLISVFSTVILAGCLFLNDRQTCTTFEEITYQKETSRDINEARTLFNKIEQYSGKKTIDTVLVPLNELDMLLDKTANKASLFYNVHPNSAIRTIAEKTEQEISRLATDISLSRLLFKA